jgi:hypothetical protein
MSSKPPVIWTFLSQITAGGLKLKLSLFLKLRLKLAIIWYIYTF